MALAPHRSLLASRARVTLLLAAVSVLVGAACGGSSSETPWPLAPSSRELKAVAKARSAPSRDPALPVLSDAEVREPRRTWRLPTDEPRDPYNDPYAAPGGAGAPNE